jgi:hypothetical protein
MGFPSLLKEWFLKCYDFFVKFFFTGKAKKYVGLIFQSRFLAKARPEGLLRQLRFLHARVCVLRCDGIPLSGHRSLFESSFRVVAPPLISS